MYRGHSIGVVVPAYNEAGFVGDVIESIPEYVDRIYVIDDGSSDDTWAEIRRAAAAVNGTDGAGDYSPTVAATEGEGEMASRVVSIRHETNRGVGGAIKTGYLEAREDEIDITAVMGGDGQMEPNLLPRFLDPIVDGEADYSKGNRLRYREYRRGMSDWRFFGNSILTHLTRVASGYWTMTDPQNGYTATSLEALHTIDIEDMYEDYGYCNDLLVKLNVAEMRVADVAMPAVYGDEVSRIRYSTYIPKVSGMLFRNFCWRLQKQYVSREFRPFVLGYVVGALASLLGAASGIRALLSRLRGGSGTIDRAATSGRLLIVGALCLSLSMLVDVRENEDLEVRQYE